ncbi:beta-ketoacyl-ACP reductase [Actinomadura sp. NBRC 104412]|uniref:SDR family oxidoreductase n=1 Tax=Actinomadura sp. NBRC 104412 TaxID=3032203 RepID=UPI0024A13F3F|nr:SDR family oxidoreductase [Actinomadura sp. NBRC 104412]GLZ06184.1 beta-ketoacyl-ACP reductase [Actinomadura sp. NBRC 104412]
MDTERLAIVVGASSGIGAETGRILAERYEVLLVARRADRLRALADEIGGSFLAADVTVAEDVRRLGEHVRERGLRPALVVYSAGVMKPSPVHRTEVEDWDRILSVNLRGAFLTARALVPALEPGARIVFVSSVAADKGQPGLSSYAASKAGLERFAESLAAELEPKGVAVHVVAPGPTATPLLDLPDTSPFQLEARRVAEVVDWLSRLPTDVVIKKITLRAPIKGPFARRRHDR